MTLAVGRPSPKFWHGRKVLVTGHTGFKGGWLATWLKEMHTEVMGYALKPETEPSFFSQCRLDSRIASVIGDIRQIEDLKAAICRFEPEVAFHLAAQSLVRRSYRDPIETFATNVMGTVCLLEAIRCAPSVRALVIVTSDKCYDNREWVWGYREHDPLGGRDPYSASKACAELVTAAYQKSYFEHGDHPVAMATLRAGNVIGGGDWAEDRAVPDAIRALTQREAVILRNPRSVRPWQHVLEPLAGYLMLAERLYAEGTRWAGAWNLGPRTEEAVTVAALVELIIEKWGTGAWSTAGENTGPYEARTLMLDWGKARQLLRWRPRLDLRHAVTLTVAWYQEAARIGPDADMYGFTRKQIQDYEALLGAS